MNERSERMSGLSDLLCYDKLPPDDANLLRHQIRIGDIHILPEDMGCINTELQWGASLASLREKGLLGT